MKKYIFLFFVGFFLSSCLTYSGYAQQSYYSNDEYKIVPKSADYVLNQHIFRCDMYDQQTYYILPDDEVYGKDANGNLVLVGFKEPSKREHTGYVATFTILATATTYGIDRYDHIWVYHSRYREIVGNLVKRKR